MLVSGGVIRFLGDLLPMVVNHLHPSWDDPPSTDSEVHMSTSPPIPAASATSSPDTEEVDAFDLMGKAGQSIDLCNHWLYGSNLFRPQ